MRSQVLFPCLVVLLMSHMCITCHHSFGLVRVASVFLCIVGRGVGSCTCRTPYGGGVKASKQLAHHSAPFSLAGDKPSGTRWRSACTVSLNACLLAPAVGLTHTCDMTNGQSGSGMFTVSGNKGYVSWRLAGGRIWRTGRIVCPGCELPHVGGVPAAAES